MLLKDVDLAPEPILLSLTLAPWTPAACVPAERVPVNRNGTSQYFFLGNASTVSDWSAPATFSDLGLPTVNPRSVGSDTLYFPFGTFSLATPSGPVTRLRPLPFPSLR